MKEYVFGLEENDFDAERHTFTGLFDVDDAPIMRMLVEVRKYPIGFGREKEWNIFDRTVVASSDISKPLGGGKSAGVKQITTGNLSILKV